jgi:hypothetical protein
LVELNAVSPGGEVVPPIVYNRQLDHCGLLGHPPDGRTRGTFELLYDPLAVPSIPVIEPGKFNITGTLPVLKGMANLLVALCLAPEWRTRDWTKRALIGEGFYRLPSLFISTVTTLRRRTRWPSLPSQPFGSESLSPLFNANLTQ